MPDTPQNYGGREWRKGLSRIARRQIDHQVTAEEPQILHTSKRDTRRWCRGKVGVEHKAVWTYWMACDIFGDRGSSFWRLICQECGKHLGLRQSVERPKEDANGG